MHFFADARVRREAASFTPDSHGAMHSSRQMLACTAMRPPRVRLLRLLGLLQRLLLRAVSHNER